MLFTNPVRPIPEAMMCCLPFAAATTRGRDRREAFRPDALNRTSNHLRAKLSYSSGSRAPVLISMHVEVWMEGLAATGFAVQGV